VYQLLGLQNIHIYCTTFINTVQEPLVLRCCLDSKATWHTERITTDCSAVYFWRTA